ncbi:MAG: PIG-L family deacetylase [Chloroflexi bacterium]|nr:PIG-L family deacetylase [Chloroflexota bacterium]
MSLKVLVLSPHPDDAESSAGGTLAKMAAAGDEITIIIATNGDKGSFEMESAKLAEVRRMEALRAAGVLGVQEVVFLDHRDGELDQLPPGHLREQFMRAIRQRKPDVLFTLDPFAPFEDHPDHRAVAFAALEAVNFAPYPLHHPEQLVDGVTPHRVAEKYFFAKNPMHANKAVDISETLDVKIAALLEHKSQVTFFFQDWMQGSGLAWEDFGALDPKGAAAEEEGAAQGMTWMIRQQARADGVAVGLEFAERFRYPTTLDQRPMTKREMKC